MRVSCLIIFYLALLTGFNATAQITFKGKVVDLETGQPLLGANIRAKSGTISQTDASGRFTLILADNRDSIYVSHTGYLSKLFGLEDRATYRLKASHLSLNEVAVVSTGYQSLPRERATGSFVQLDENTLKQQVGSSLLQRLGSITNGMSAVAQRLNYFDQDALLVRGMSSYTSGMLSPLVIVDNFEYIGNLNNINPNEVETVTVLKDAAAASIWGAKAANGVIVITTKKAKETDALYINASANLSIVTAPDLNYLQTIPSPDLIEVEKYLFGQKYRFADTSRNTHPTFSPVYELLFAQSKGKVSAAETERLLMVWGNNDVRNDFTAYFYQRGINQQYALNMGRGNQRSTWNLNLSADRNTGILGERSDRYTLRWGNSINLAEWMSLSLGVNGTQVNSITGAPAYGSIRPNNADLYPYFSFVDDTGMPNPLYTIYRQGYIDDLGNGKLLDWKYYPLTDYQHDRTESKLSNLAARASLDLKLARSVKFSLQYRYQVETTRSENLSSEESFAARHLINNYTQIGTNGVPVYKIPIGAILNWKDASLSGHNLRGQLGWNPKWDRHRIDVIVGAEGSSLKNSGQQDRIYGYNPETLSSSQVDPTTRFPLLATGATTVIPKNTDFTLRNTRFLSFYTNASYTFDGRYTFSASARRDASNLFGVITNDKWKPLWSFGGLWNIVNEAFWKWKLFDRLSFRTTYGLQGNLDPSKVAVTTIAYGLSNPYLQTPIARVANYPNPELKWEQVAQLNLGLDFSILKQRLGGSVEWYSKKLSDMYAGVPVDFTTGIGSGSALRNVGEGSGNGWDVQLHGNYKIESVNIRHDIIFNTYNDKVKRLYEPPTVASNAMSNGISPIEGYSPTALFAYRWGGLDPATGAPRGYLNGNLSTNSNDIIANTTFAQAAYVGNLLPKYNGSVGTTITWKNLSATVRVTYKLGYVFRQSSISYSDLIGRLQGHSDYVKRWQQPGDEMFTDVPSFIYPAVATRDQLYNFSEVLVEKGNHFRLQWVNLAYQLPKGALKGLHAKSLELYANGSNLGLLWKANKHGLDPDYSTLPATPMYSFGLRFGF